MKVLSYIKNHKVILIFIISAVLLIATSVITYSLLNHKDVATVIETNTSKEEDSTDKSAPKKVEKSVVNKVSPATPQPAVQEEPTIAPSTQEQEAIPARPDYLHPSLKSKLSSEQEAITWQCFTLAQDIVLNRNNISDVSLVAQVSRSLINPCSNIPGDYRPNGNFIAGYVEWCVQKAAGKPVSPIVSDSVAASMCAGF